MTDFPRGWTLTQSQGASAASITLAAVAGVVHVLDSFTAKILQTGNPGSGALLNVSLSSSDGVFSAVPLTELAIGTANASVDEASGTGLDLAAGPGASLTIAFNAAVAGITQMLVVQGHDI